MKYPVQIVIFLLSGMLAAHAQGIVTGTVSDAQSGETLISAYVYVEGTEKVSATDFDGKYRFELSAGTYALRLTYIGFQEKTVTGVEVEDGEVTYLDVFLASATQELDEVTITAEVIERSENALLMLQKRSDKIQDGISSQEMSRLAVGNVASAMTKVTGTSVQEGKYVVVRGLGDRYSIMMLNDLPLPSIDPYRNSAQLDLIPTDLLDNIITSKTFSPDQPGTFTGGSVNIRTKSFPEQETFSVSVSTTVNTMSSFQDDFLTYEGGDRDWLGYGTEARQRPAILMSEMFDEYGDQNAELKARFGDEMAAQTIDNVVNAMDMRFDTLKKSSFMDYGVSLSYGNSFATGARSSLGVIASVSHKNSYDHQPDMISASYLAMIDNAGNPFLRTNGDYRITRSQENPIVNGFAGVAYKFNALNSVDFKVMYNHNSTKTTSFVIGEDGDNIEDPNFKLGRALEFEERQLVDYQLEGKSVIPSLNNLEIAYKASLVDARRHEPNIRYLTSQWNSEANTHGIPLANVNDPFFFWRELQDDIVNGKVDITLPFDLGNISGNKLKVGVFVSRKDRDFNEFQYRVQKSQFAESFKGDPDTFFGPDNTGVIRTEQNSNGSTRHFIGNYITQATSPRNSYFGHEDVTAFYGMFTVHPFAPLKIVAGARYEETDIFVQSKIVTNGIEEADSANTGSIQESDVLPSINMVYALTESMNLRASYNHTLARPNLREIAPFASFDPVIDEFFNGNPQLKKTDIRNLDLRWEWFMHPGELLAVSGFYKSFDDPIVVQYLVSTNPEFIFVNADKGEIRGLEFEFRKNLGFLGGALSNFKLSTNLALISSSTDVVSSFEVQQEERSFVGQSDVLANVILNYVNPDRGWDVALAYNFTGDRLKKIGQLTETAPPTDIFEKEVNQLDFVATKKLGNVSLKFTALNLLNPDIIEYIPFAGSDTVTGQFRRGVSFGLSAQFKI